LTWEQMAPVLAPKVWGAWNLHELTQHCRLDLFVLYSSAASLVGSPGQGSHVAANSFLDALAHHRRHLGLPALSINWGPWSDVGSAATDSIRQQMRSRGVGTISPSQGKQALSQLLLNSTSPQVGVVPIQWSQMQQTIDRDPFFANFNSWIGGQVGNANTVVSAASPDKTVAADWLSQLNQIPQRQRISFLTEALKTEVARVLGLTGQPDTTTSFFDMGMDSLMAVELKNQLDTRLGTPVPSTIIFEFPTIRTLATHLVAMVYPPNEPPDPGPDSMRSADESPPDIEEELAALETLLERS
ncbi:MAG: beta-ketoacyl reductase, partial [Cyanobacteria bacterium P01_D01_bin.2]